MTSISKVLVGVCLGAAAVGCSESSVGSSSADLTAAQCDYFAVNGKVQICHATGSRTKPYTILKLAEAACVNAHAGHAGDYIAIGDPTCSGGGCLPEDAPCDATLPCCDGSSCQAGTCVADAQPPARPALPSASAFMWQGASEGLAADGRACGGVVTAGMGDQAMCYTADNGALMCAGRVFQTTWGPSFVDTGLRDVEQVFISPTFNAANGNAMCVKKANGTIWCMGNGNNAIFGYPPTGETSATFVQWGSADDNYRIATGTWDQLCSLHTDGRIDCSGYGFGGSYHAPVLIADAGHHSVWVDGGGGAHVDDGSTFRVAEGRATCRVTAAGLDCGGEVFGDPGNVAAGGEVHRFESTCWLDGGGRVLCGNASAPTQHFPGAPVIHLFYSPYALAVCAVKNDGSLWCFGENDFLGQGMLGTGSTGDLAGDTMIEPPGSVRLPSCQ